MSCFSLLSQPARTNSSNILEADKLFLWAVVAPEGSSSNESSPAFLLYSEDELYIGIIPGGRDFFESETGKLPDVMLVCVRSQHPKFAKSAPYIDWFSHSDSH